MEAKSSLPKVLKWCCRKQESLGPLGSLAVGQEGISVSESGQLGLGGGLTFRLLALHLMMRVQLFLQTKPFMGILLFTPNSHPISILSMRKLRPREIKCKVTEL